MAQQDNPFLTITLTGRRPVKINKNEWPIIAEAEDYSHDGQVECQSNVRTRCRMIVRQKTDGKTIVYGVYKYESNWQNARCYDIRGGELLPGPDGIPEAIQRVGSWMVEHLPSEHEDDQEVFARVIQDCIADLPAEEL